MTHGIGSRLRHTRVLWPALAILAAACTATVGPTQGGGGTGTSQGEPNGPGGAANNGGGGGSNVGGNPSTGGGGNMAGSNQPGSAGMPGSTTGAAPSGPLDPGRVTIRRLTRAEYDNTVRDLLGTAQTPGASTFLSDVPEIGFDNNGDLQTLSPVQVTLYQSASQALAAEAMTGTARAKLVTCDLTTGMTCAQTLVQNFGLRAFRRPLTTAEVTNFTTLMTTAAAAGATSDEQFRTVVEAMLLSPNFLFRPEIDADPTSLTPHALSPYETASRLSYTIYRSMPDQALFDAAAAGKLAQPADIQAQVTRMLADPKSAFAATFASAWLGTQNIPNLMFDATMFPSYSAALGTSMTGEVSNFFNDFLSKNEPVTQLLTANFSFIDKNLATLYGVPAAGATLTRTTLTTPQRGGLLTMAGVLAVTSYPNRTSLVKRGAYVLSQMLCAAPPPPPANVPPFPSGPIVGTTQKQILAAHRTLSACATCHDSIDNVGIAMENYDAIGTYRTTENGFPVDASGMLTGAIAEPGGAVGPSFTGAIQLSTAIAADPRFTSCVAQNVLSYSLGRTLSAADQPYLATITQAPQTGSLGVRDVLMNVVASDTFRMRHGETP